MSTITLTPSASNTRSSAVAGSSAICIPYERPEQPPPATKTRMPWNVPPFCSMMFLISAAALSLKVTIGTAPPSSTTRPRSNNPSQSNSYAYVFDARAVKAVQRIQHQGYRPEEGLSTNWRAGAVRGPAKLHNAKEVGASRANGRARHGDDPVAPAEHFPSKEETH